MIRVGVEASIDQELLQGFSKDIELVRIPEIPEDPQSFLELDFWITSLSGATSRKQWPHLKGVRVVQSLFAGVDAFLPLIPKGVTLCDAREVHNIPVAEWAVTAVLTMQKYIPFYVELQRNADWDGREQAEQIYLLSEGAKPGTGQPVLLDEIADMTVLIVGYGSIGEAIETRLAPFGANFLRIARSARAGVEPVSKLDDLLPRADIVILITPLTSETLNLMDANRLAKMKRGALLVNAGRGPVVNTDALLAALQAKKIRAAIDVMDPEPLPASHPLWHAPNLLITPHIASDSAKFTRRAFQLATAQANRYAKGEPLLNIVTGEY
jgi:phosphoglycerate dehydrogenase-like enzyme